MKILVTGMGGFPACSIPKVRSNTTLPVVAPPNAKSRRDAKSGSLVLLSDWRMELFGVTFRSTTSNATRMATAFQSSGRRTLFPMPPDKFFRP
jgi:hypothetical protein